MFAGVALHVSSQHLDQLQDMFPQLEESRCLSFAR